MTEIIKGNDNEFREATRGFFSWLGRLIWVNQGKLAANLRDDFPTAAAKNWTYREGMIEMSKIVNDTAEVLEQKK